MVDRPIIFSGPMVRALLAGRKSQTRRLETSPLRRCAPGDRLYVRERFRVGYDANWYREDLGRPAKPKEMDPAITAVEYLADGERELGGKSYPSIHMPRWASRLTLIVADVRVEPIQLISEADAWDEGVCAAVEADDIAHGKPAFGAIPRHYRHLIVEQTFGGSVQAYHWLWDHLHTEPGQRWEDNPSVIALTFRVIHSNIDRIKA